jgi:phage tail sheath protein FI
MAGGLTIENSLPGITVRTNTAQVARAIDRQPSSTAFVVLYSPWGPVNVPTVVTSWPEFARTFGGFDVNSPGADALYIFFQFYSGKNAVVCRVAGGAKALGTLTLKDKSAGAGVNTLRVDAKYPSTRVDIFATVAAGTSANTFKLTLRSVFFGAAFTEVWDNLTLAAADLDNVNQRSKLITLTNLASVTVAPNNIPKVLVETALAGGSDDFAGLAASDYIGTDTGTTRSGLQTFNDRSYGIGQVAIPGITTDTTHAALFAHGTTYRRYPCPDAPSGSDKSAVAALRANYDTQSAFLWPWPKMQDVQGGSTLKFYPPSAVMLGECARADMQFGTHRAPANLDVVPGAVDVERYSNGQSQIDDTTREYLNSHQVNVIAPLPNKGIRVYGARVMSSDLRTQFVHEVRMLYMLEYSLQLGLGFAVFSTIDRQGRLFRDLESTIRNFLQPFKDAGALWDFTVTVDRTDLASLSVGRVPVHVLVQLSQTAERIEIFLDNVPLFQDLKLLQ